MPYRATICTSKEDLRRSSLILETLERKIDSSRLLQDPNSEYVFNVFSTDNHVEDENPVLAVAVYDDNTYAVIASETLSVDARNKLFTAFIAETLFPEDVLVVFTRLDYDAAKAARSAEEIDIKLM